VAVSCRAMIRALARSTTSIGEILETTNAQLVIDLEGGRRFLTLCLAVIDSATATMTFASAGHGPLLHYRAATDSFTELAISGPPLGLFGAMTSFPRPPIQLASGDMFVVPTDGFYEYAGKDGEFFGSDRIRDVLRAHRSEPARVMAER